MKERCLECRYLKVVPIEDTCGIEARCCKTSKRGKSITWAMTTIGETGFSRVVKSLVEKEKAPFWCPLKNNQGV